MSLENVTLFILCLFLSWLILRLFRNKNLETQKNATSVTEKELYILKAFEVENRELTRQEILKISLGFKVIKIKKAEFYILILKLEEKGLIVSKHIRGNKMRLSVDLYNLTKKGKRLLGFVNEEN